MGLFCGIDLRSYCECGHTWGQHVGVMCNHDHRDGHICECFHSSDERETEIAAAMRYSDVVSIEFRARLAKASLERDREEEYYEDIINA